MKYTTIGHFDSDPRSPLSYVVEASSPAAAIQAAESAAHDDFPGSASDPFLNDFVIAGEAEILSTWAG